MRAKHLLWILIALTMHASQARSAAITLRTGQVSGAPGTCTGLDDTFRFWAPQPLCSFPLLSSAFLSSDFDSACAGRPAVVIDPEPFAWVSNLACDPDARWIDSAMVLGPGGRCSGKRQSVLYCAQFMNRTACVIADSIRVCWAVDDYLGDPAAFPGPNPGGVYLNGTDLGPAFRGLGAAQQQTAVVYNVPLNAGLNSLAVYQRDAGCGTAGLILSATVHLCRPLPAEAWNWGAIKVLFR